MLTCFNINFDSLHEAFGFDYTFRNSSYYTVFDRFLRISDKYRFKYSIFIIGKDLGNPGIFARVREWAQEGHEIGNHSWDHSMNLAYRSLDEIREDVVKAHDLISKCIGKEPNGFISPAWAQSLNLKKVLCDLNYLYDTSDFPSPLILPLMLNVFLNDPRNQRTRLIMKRKEIIQQSFKKRDVYFVRPYETMDKGLWEIPLPTNSMRLPIWHTMSYMLGRKPFKLILESYVDIHGHARGYLHQKGIKL